MHSQVFKRLKLFPNAFRPFIINFRKLFLSYSCNFGGVINSSPGKLFCFEIIRIDYGEVSSFIRLNSG